MMAATHDGRQRRHRRISICVSLSLALVAIIGLLPLLTVRKWVGSRELEVYVLVSDAETMQPLPEAIVTLFRGYHSSPEMPIPRLPQEEMRPDPDDEQTQVQLTDSDGRAVFSRRFFAAGDDHLFYTTGSIRTSDTWVHITARGYSTVMLPLDGQSTLPRDIDNDLPVRVTLLLFPIPED